MRGPAFFAALALLAIFDGRIEGADASMGEKIKAIRQRYAEIERELNPMPAGKARSARRVSGRGRIED